MKKYMVQSKKSCFWHYAYFETEQEALKYIDCITESTCIALYCKSKGGGYRLIKEF